MDNSIIGLGAFIVSYIAGRLVSERALKLLSEKEQGKLLQGFSRYRVFSLIGVIILVVIHYAAQSLSPDSYLAHFPVFVGVLVLYLLGSSIYAYRKLKQLELPDNYINQFLLSTLIQYVGLFVFFGFLIDAK
jgi:predicted membrane channel-forming protein YqfA (hemolysin III family)